MSGSIKEVANMVHFLSVLECRMGAQSCYESWKVFSVCEKCFLLNRKY